MDQQLAGFLAVERVFVFFGDHVVSELHRKWSEQVEGVELGRELHTAVPHEIKELPEPMRERVEHACL